MKTIKTLLKQLLSGSNQNDADENTQNSLTQNSNPNETENDENPGTTRVDNPDARQSDGADKEELSPEPSNPSEPGSRGDESRRDAGESEKLTQQNPEKEEETVQAAIQKAYNQGVIDGRNAHIEEKYFPKTDDGIPSFHGRRVTPSSSSDIFSMAREA